jgi:hypothetical protein
LKSPKLNIALGRLGGSASIDNYYEVTAALQMQTQIYLKLRIATLLLK